MKHLGPLLLLLTLTLPVLAQNKNSLTPMPLDAGFGHMNIAPPAVPAEEIIQKFAARESAFQKALGNYTYRRAARIQELDDDNKVSGEYYMVDDVVFDCASS